jgi:hypothetical protein
MQTKVRRADRTRARRAAFLSAAVLVLGVFACLPASAQLLPPLPPLPLPTSSTGVDLNRTVDDVTGLLNDVPDQLGSIVDDTTASLTLPTGGGSTPPGGGSPVTNSPSVSGPLSVIPAVGLLPGTSGAPTRIDGTRLRRNLSYGAALSNGFRAAAGRAAALAGPLAAPIALALIAMGLIAIAARGPGRLVKVEEERLNVRERRSYRL